MKKQLLELNKLLSSNSKQWKLISTLFIDNDWGDAKVTILGRIIKELVKYEINTGGPYCSKLTEKPTLEENIYINELLLSNDIYLQPLNDWIQNIIQNMKSSQLQQRRYLSSIHKYNKRKQKVGINLPDKYEKYFEQTKSLFIGEFQEFCKPILLSEKVQGIVNKILGTGFTKEVILLPCFVADSYTYIKPNRLRQISNANLWGWLYFAILDFLIDENIEKDLCRELMLLSNAIYVKYCSLITELSGENNITALIEPFFINLRELKNGVTRSTVKTRSIPYFLATKIVLLKQGVKPNKVSILSCVISNYLLAKQLHDDLHDFYDDFKSGKNSLITSEIAKLNLKTDKETFEVFLKKILPEKTEEIGRLIKDIKKEISDFIPVLKLEQGLQEYYNIRKQYNSLK